MKELLKKKITKIGIAVIILAVAIGIISINVRSAQRQREYDGHVEAAEKYLTELDYEQAIAEYTLALEIEPYNEEVLNALEQTYLDYAQSLADAGDYEKAVSVLEEGYAQTGMESLREKMEELKVIQEQEERTEEIKAVSRYFNAIITGCVYHTDEQVEALCRPLVSLLEEYAAIFPDDYYNYRSLCECYYLLGEYELCPEAREQIYELTGDDWYAVEETGREASNRDMDTYDKYGRLIVHYIGGSFGPIYYEYGGNGKLIQQTYFNGSEFNHERTLE